MRETRQDGRVRARRMVGTGEASDVQSRRMSAAELLVFGTIAVAVITWALAEVFASRLLWSAGAVLTVVHSVVAFVVFYDGSHATARAETMRQTATLTGIEFAGGIYVNYAFLVVWTTDAVWWWMAPHSYAARPKWVSWAVRGFIFFIILNGAVIFADGWARVTGVAAVATVLLNASMPRWRQWFTVPGTRKSEYLRRS